ncbi:cytochrome P450 [Allocatelliglobosispora scoriae]|uniref:Cytochrome P450 n=1 Tax=Allocatelliglobosispora scoriae TaxID=643052 RepID=A0A841C112_9ACTN|nr:cytochrome P450 [Allocatelliglobosispora scoriae]MBB5872571.1 cytochrome P450 [Allocatelliglobosispora scoriae]
MELQALLSEAGRVNPYQLYAQLHSAGAASHLDVSKDGYDLAVFGYDAVNQLLRDGRFRQLDADYLDVHSPRWREHPVLQTLRDSIFFTDGPEHARLRRLVGQLFTARRVAVMEPAITKLIHDRLDRIAQLGADGDTVDFMAEFAYAVPSCVIGDLLGVPEADRGWMRPRVLAISAIFELDGSTWPNMTRADAATRELTAYFAGLVAQRRLDPRDDLISDLARLQAETPGVFSDAELIANLITLFNAGFVTTTHLFGNGLAILADRPELRDELVESPERAPSYVEEILRVEPPAHFVVRYASSAETVGGLPCDEGSTILVMLGAANRDPSIYAEPDVFDPSRFDAGGPVTPILTFGAGGHYCLGAAMTRLEGAIAFPAIFERFPGLHLATEPPPPTQLMFRGHDVLPIRLR